MGSMHEVYLAQYSGVVSTVPESLAGKVDDVGLRFSDLTAASPEERPLIDLSEPSTAYQTNIWKIPPELHSGFCLVAAREDVIDDPAAGQVFVRVVCDPEGRPIVPSPRTPTYTSDDQVGKITVFLRRELVVIGLDGFRGKPAHWLTISQHTLHQYDDEVLVISRPVYWDFLSGLTESSVIMSRFEGAIRAVLEKYECHVAKGPCNHCHYSA